MLLPSALPCDHGQAKGTKSTRPLLRRFIPYNNSGASASAFLTMTTIPQVAPLPPVTDLANAEGFPFPSPLLSPSTITSGIQSTCRALQAFLGVTASSIPVTAKRNKIPLPSTCRGLPLQALPIQDHRIAKKRSSPKQPRSPPRGRNKRTRDDYEATNHENSMEVDLQNSPTFAFRPDHGYNYDSGYQGSSSSEGDIESAGISMDIKMFSTPKRRRRLPGPVDLPFGLDRQDFADLDDAPSTFCTPQSARHVAAPHYTLPIAIPSTPPPAAALNAIPDDGDNEDGEDWWTPLDDAQLVTCVLEKMKFTRRDWEDCAKVLGAEGEGGSLGKRWKWLMEEGKVGLKTNFNDRGRFEGRRTSKRQVRADIRSYF